jgi:hypothetical protein
VKPLNIPSFLMVFFFLMNSCIYSTIPPNSSLIPNVPFYSGSPFKFPIPLSLLPSVVLSITVGATGNRLGWQAAELLSSKLKIGVNKTGFYLDWVRFYTNIFLLLSS